jgi:hypothetical protein
MQKVRNDCSIMLPGHVNEEKARHLPCKMLQFCVPQRGFLNLESVRYVLFGIAEKQYIADPRTSKHQYYEPD